MTLPDMHSAEAIPDTARAEIEQLLQSGDLFRYTCLLYTSPSPRD